MREETETKSTSRRLMTALLKITISIIYIAPLAPGAEIQTFVYSVTHDN